MNRQITYKIYVFAFIVTSLIFVLGFTIGLAVEKERLQNFDIINTEQEVDLRSLQLQEAYIELGNANCDALNHILEGNIAEVADSMDKILEFNKKSVFDEKLFNLQLRDYFLTEIQFLIAANEIKTKCESDAVIIIYFYDEDQQDVQGEVLNYMKDKMGSKILVFSFDSNFKDEPMIEVMLKTYNVTEFPTVVANDKIYSGGVGSEELREFICQELEYENGECL
ncbi:MAG: hypothetical protein Q8Q35_04075 [Nanoarchaeota archaeon]|nr:hypothetical protein [Nanoarchaeota archaeon]